jgi:hypothetical protein
LRRTKFPRIHFLPPATGKQNRVHLADEP